MASTPPSVSTVGCHVSQLWRTVNHASCGGIDSRKTWVLCALCPRLDVKPLSSRGSHWKQHLYSYEFEVCAPIFIVAYEFPVGQFSNAELVREFQDCWSKSKSFRSYIGMQSGALPIHRSNKMGL